MAATPSDSKRRARSVVGNEESGTAGLDDMASLGSMNGVRQKKRPVLQQALGILVACSLLSNYSLLGLTSIAA